jgi:hypothetical protein
MAPVRRIGGVALFACLLGHAGCGGDPAVSTADPDIGVPIDFAVEPIASADGGDGGPGDGGGDAGTVAPLPVRIPGGSAHWTFYGPASGGPNQVFGASFDDGGNLWVAGGEQGLYVLRAGAASFTRFTMADGLRPYGYMPDGSDPPGDKYLNVISVSGAWAGTAFVGYQGKLPGPGEVECEDNWDGANPDPAIYKSGDADRVTLAGGGISVVHYDISSGAGIVGGELRGREKLCDIFRIRYDSVNKKVWFGANHGFAMGDANYQGTSHCQWAATASPPVPTEKSDPLSNAPGHEGCSGVLEHTHPALNGYANNGSCCVYLTGGYYGVAPDPVTHDIWFAGQFRTTKFHYASTGGDYYTAELQTEAGPNIANRIDIWPDAVEEPGYPMKADRVDDFVSGAAAMDDGTLWVSSFQHGIAHLDASGNVIARVTAADGLAADKLGAIAVDPLDQSLWVGTNFGPGLSRLRGGAFVQYDAAALGDDLAWEGVSDVQSAGSGASRKIVVSFPGDATHAGAVGVYDGP